MSEGLNGVVTTPKKDASAKSEKVKPEKVKKTATPKDGDVVHDGERFHKPEHVSVPDATQNVERIALKRIYADDAWNSRREYEIEPDGREFTKPEGLEEGLSDLEFEQSIRDRGVMQPVKVRHLSASEKAELAKKGIKDVEFFLVFGFRRYRTLLRVSGPDAIITAVISPDFGSARDNDLAARIDNLAENINRRNLRPHEKATAFCALIEQHPDTSGETIAKSTGLSKTYVNNLIRLKRKLCPQLWLEFESKGETMRLDDLVKVCKLAKSEQVEAYEEERKRRKGGRPSKDGDGDGDGSTERAPKPKPADFCDSIARAASARKKKDDLSAAAKLVLEGMRLGAKAVKDAIAEGEVNVDWQDVIDNAG